MLSENSQPLALTRREFLGTSVKLTLFSALTLNAASSLATLTGGEQVSDDSFVVLRDADVHYFGAMLPAIITSATSTESKQAFLKSLDNMLTPTSEATLATIQGFVDLVTNSMARRVMTLRWNDWSDLSAIEIDEVLNDWRSSSIELKVMAYALTTQLTRMGWYMIADNQQSTGYPGPPMKIVTSVESEVSNA